MVRSPPIGLPPTVAHPSEAAFAYLQCLRDASAPNRFFHRSLQVDAMNVARTLLGWRTRWHEAGWDGTFPDTAPARLTDMAAVEALARNNVPPSPGERLGRVAAALGKRVAQIDCVEPHTSADALPYAWRSVLDALRCELAPGLAPAPAGRDGSDLARVQSRLLAIADGTVEWSCQLRVVPSFGRLRSVPSSPASPRGRTLSRDIGIGAPASRSWRMQGRVRRLR